MEATLIKTDTGYYFWLNPNTKEQSLLGGTEPYFDKNGVDMRQYKLSLSNCQSIEEASYPDDLKHLQEKNQWQVNIVMGIHSVYVPKGLETIYPPFANKPKVDNQGNIILTLIK